MAYVSASLFALCAALSIVIGILTGQAATKGGFDYPEIAVSSIGIAFGNGDASTDSRQALLWITAGIGAAVLLLAIAMFFRLGFARWTLAGLGVVVSLYYVFAVIRVVSLGGASRMAFLVIVLLVWLAATVIVMLPPVGQGMRGYKPPAFGQQAPGYGYPPQPGYPQQPGYAPQQSGYPQPGYPPQQPGYPPTRT